VQLCRSARWDRCAVRQSQSANGQLEGRLSTLRYFVLLLGCRRGRVGTWHIGSHPGERASSRRGGSSGTEKVFVESLDKCFENVCELDLIFHFDEVSLMDFVGLQLTTRLKQVHLMLSCIIVSGMVLDVHSPSFPTLKLIHQQTSIDSISINFKAHMKARKASQNEGDLTKGLLSSASEVGASVNSSSWQRLGRLIGKGSGTSSFPAF
jgi:hypothetical protein